MEFFLHQDIPDDPTLKHPAIVTNNEADDYLSFKNQTIATIYRQIVDVIETVGDEDKKFNLPREGNFKEEKRSSFNLFAGVLEILNEEKTSVDLSDSKEADTI